MRYIGANPVCAPARSSFLADRIEAHRLTQMERDLINMRSELSQLREQNARLQKEAQERARRQTRIRNPQTRAAMYGYMIVGLEKLEAEAEARRSAAETIAATPAQKQMTEAAEEKSAEVRSLTRYSPRTKEDVETGEDVIEILSDLVGPIKVDKQAGKSSPEPEKVMLYRKRPDSEDDAGARLK